MPVAVTGGEVEVLNSDLPKTVQLTGAASTPDAGETITAYLWTVVEMPEGSTASLSGAATAAPSLVVDRAGTYLFVLRVTDSGGGVSDTDVRTMPASAMSFVTVPTAVLGLVAPAWQQRVCSRALQRNSHALEAEAVAVRARLTALEGA